MLPLISTSTCATPEPVTEDGHAAGGASTLDEVTARALHAVQHDRHFFDGGATSAAAFWRSPSFNETRSALFLTHMALRSVVPDTEGNEPLRRYLQQSGSRFSRPTAAPDDEQAQMMGAGKRLLVTLFQAVEAQPDAASRAVVCHLMHTRLCSPGASAHPPVTRLGQAVNDVVALHNPAAARQRCRLAQQALTDWVSKAGLATPCSPDECVQSLLDYFGLQQRDVVPDTSIDAQSLGAQRLNDAYKACVLRSHGAGEAREPALTVRR